MFALYRCHDKFAFNKTLSLLRVAVANDASRSNSSELRAIQYKWFRFLAVVTLDQQEMILTRL